MAFPSDYTKGSVPSRKALGGEDEGSVGSIGDKIGGMIRRFALALVFLVPLALDGQQPAPAGPLTPRAIRRDVPMTNSIHRAWDAGTRDKTGRPGPNYWQLATDYTIDPTLDPASQTLTGTEKIALHNNSPQE